MSNIKNKTIIKTKGQVTTQSKKADKIANQIAKILEPKNTKGSVDYSDIKAQFNFKNKYLEALGIKQKSYGYYNDIESNDSRWPKWLKSRQNYGGVCSIDTWDMGLSIWPIRLFTELKMFMELSNEAMDKTEIEYKGKKYKKDKYIEKIISLLEEYIVYYYKTQPDLLGRKDFDYDYQKMYKDEEKYNDKYLEALRMLPNVALGLWW